MAQFESLEVEQLCPKQFVLYGNDPKILLLTITCQYTAFISFFLLILFFQLPNEFSFDNC